MKVAVRAPLVIAVIVGSAAAVGGGYLFHDYTASRAGDPTGAAPPPEARPPYDFAGRPVGRAPDGAPNIILITIDSLRPDHLGCYGYERDTSPNIDRIASEGVLFEEAVASSSWTLPSHMAIFTSLYDSVHGVVDTDSRLVIDHPTLAEVLREAGYATAGFYSAPNTYPEWGFSLGFDAYYNCTSYPREGDTTWGEPKDPLYRRTTLSWADITNPTVHRSVSGWLEQKAEEPFFLFIHYWDVHHDYLPPEPYDTLFDPDYDGKLVQNNVQDGNTVHPNMAPGDLEHLIALYDGEIRWTDEWIGKLRETLERQGLLDRTLLVITSDHGEEFFEHGEVAHAKNLFDESIRVPMIFRLPGKVRPGFRARDQVRTIDIYPTLVEAAGVGPVDGLLGRSLLPVLDGREEEIDLPPAISEIFVRLPELRSFRTLEDKVIRYIETGDAVYFDRTEDPGEHDPILIDAEAAPRARAALAGARKHAAAIADRRRILEADGRDPSFRPDPETLERLRSLGYAK